MLARDDGELGDDRLAVEGELAERLRVHAHDRGGARLAAARFLAQPRAEPLHHVAPHGGRRGPRHREGQGWGGGSRVSARCLGFGGAATARGRRRHVAAEQTGGKGREQETGRRFVRNRNGEDLVSAMLSFFA